MAQRDRRALRTTQMAVQVVFEPSRIADECLARAYAVAVPPVRRRLPMTGAPAPPERARAAAAQQRGGAAR